MSLGLGAAVLCFEWTLVLCARSLVPVRLQACFDCEFLLFVSD